MRSPLRTGFITLLLGSLCCIFISTRLCASEPSTSDLSFEQHIAPLLIKRCVECHQLPSPSGNLDLTNLTSFQSGGDSGPPFDPQQPDTSLLLEYVRSGEMPPPEKGVPRPLPANEIERLKQWFDRGAPWPENRKLDLFEKTNDQRAGRDWWSLQPLSTPTIPVIASTHPWAQSTNPIDAFIGEQLHSQNLTPAPQADRRTLIRRLYYDLIGLPPTESQIAEFLADSSPDAWQRQIGRLLDSPQYGEHWARYWLDLVRYADTSGYERDQEKPFAWKYRDWVIDAFNNDLPYNQFVIEQLAGDEIENANEQSIIATGFLRLGAWNDEPNEPLDYQYDRLEDLVHTTTSAFIGLTVKCARCHAHKFDAITQDDYYRVASAFWPGPIAARDRDLLGGPSESELGVKDVLAWTDITKTPAPLNVLKSGERHHPLHEITPGTPSFLPTLQHSFSPPDDKARTTQRRLQLAQWITHADNPLTPRVMVNRIWLHHFGQALVRTPNNFGFLADPPTHPKLLDWLATEFQRSGGHLKPLHRLILTSQTWQQSSQHPDYAHFESIDPTNRLWWRAERRRLAAEPLRDSLLAASGELDLTQGGAAFRPTLSPAALEGLSQKSAAWQASPKDAQHRRTIYCYMKRGLLPPLLTSFDLCDATQPCGQRDSTIVPTQALALLNGQFTHERGIHLASATIQQHPSPTDQIAAVWSAIFARQPSELETKLALQHLESQLKHLTTEATTTSNNPPPTHAQYDLDQHLTFRISGDHITTDEQGRVTQVTDLSSSPIPTQPPQIDAAPSVVADAINGHAAIYFNGQNQYLSLDRSPLTAPECTILVVAWNETQSGNRELISNWRAGENVGSSLFLGLTASNTVRFSDALSSGGEIPNPSQPFLLVATNGPSSVQVRLNGQNIAQLPDPLPGRNPGTPWVIGQQGNINGEFWHGGIAEIQVHSVALDEQTLRAAEQQLADVYALPLRHDAPAEIPTQPPQVLALASLCHVLFNANEFIYVD